MRRKLRFIRLSERWFTDMSWEGSVDDLEMVGNASLLISTYSGDSIIVDTSISTIEGNDYDIHLTLDSVDAQGAVYLVNSERFNGDIWLSKVTQFVFGDYPKEIFVKII